MIIDKYWLDTIIICKPSQAPIFYKPIYYYDELQLLLLNTFLFRNHSFGFRLSNKDTL